jgi:uncharacterized protein YcfL
MLNRLQHGFKWGSSGKRWLILSMLVLGLTACSSTPTVDEMTVRMRETSDIQITDMRSIVSHGLLTAQVSVTNKGADKPVYYRFRWLNQSGMQVGDGEAWKPLTIGEGQSGVLTGIAPHPSASDFKFELSSD